jgi:hypothetical protein
MEIGVFGETGLNVKRRVLGEQGHDIDHFLSTARNERGSNSQR